LPIMVQYGVAVHRWWGKIEGQSFSNEGAARSRFAQLDGGRCAVMLLGPEGQEIEYYGSRGGREKEMQQWWLETNEKVVISNGAPVCGNGYPVPPMDWIPPSGGSESVAPIDCLVIGAGARGGTYSDHPGLRPVAVADPNATRRADFAARHKIALECQYSKWEDALAAVGTQYCADACMVATPDRLHVEPAIAACALFKGLLLEKPMAVTEEDCEKIVAACEEHGTICAICHVLRYNFANMKVLELIQAGAIGEVLTVNHTEPVGYFHFAHSFVRGNWRNEAESTNSLLAKCCHDVDLISSWMIDDRCVRVSSFGSLQHFRPDKKPVKAGAAKRCLDCPIKETCAYSATRLYLDPKQTHWARHLVNGVETAMDIENLTVALREGPYGRCAYECDNDVCDHQVVNFEFASGATATLTMIATTERLCERETKVYGSAGELSSTDPLLVRHVDFASGEVREYRPDVDHSNALFGGHGGADGLLVEAFVAAVRAGDKFLVLTSPQESLASHRLAFAADRARKLRQVVEL